MEPRCNCLLMGVFVFALTGIPAPVPARSVAASPWGELKDPAYREEMRAQWRLSTAAKYAWLVRKLELSPELADRFYDLQVRQIFETLEGPTQSVNSQNGVPILTPEYQALRRRQDRAVAELIGERGLAQLRAYDESFEYRSQVMRLQSDFAGDIDILREAQVDAMIGILRDAEQKFPRTRPSNAAPHDQRVREQAVTVLAPAQFATLDARIRRERGYEGLRRIAAQIVPPEYAAFVRAVPGRRGPFLAGINDDQLVRHSEYRRAWLVQKRREVEATYVDVPRLLKLSPELTERFFTLQVDQQLARLDDPKGPYNEWNDRLRQEERELAALLGPRGLAQFHEWQTTSDYRRQVRYLQIDIGGGPGSLQQPQVEALISAMVAASEELRRAAPPILSQLFTTRRERQRQEARRSELRRQRDARVRESAETFLTAPQLAALEAWLQRDPG